MEMLWLLLCSALCLRGVLGEHFLELSPDPTKHDLECLTRARSIMCHWIPGDNVPPVDKYTLELEGYPIVELSSATREYTFVKNIEPEKQYTIKFTAIFLTGEKELQTINETTPEIEPYAPRDLNVEVLGKDIKVSWKAPVQSGKILYYTAGLLYEIDKAPFLRNVNETETTFTNNFDNKFYFISVNATTSAGPGTGATYGPVQVPAIDISGKLNVSSLNASAVNLKWTLPKTDYPITSNTVYYIVDEFIAEKKIEPPAETYVLTELMEGKEYGFRVMGICGTNPVVGTEFTRKENPPLPPSAPMSVHLSKPTATSVVVHWDPPVNISGKLEKYRVRTIPTHIEKFADAQEFSVLLDGLKPYTNYTINVDAKAEKNDEYGPHETIEMRTLPSAPSAPLNVNIQELANTNFVVHWETPKSPNGVLESYRVRISTKDTPLTVAADETSTLIEDLTPNTQYTVSVDAKTIGVAEYGESGTAVATTMPDDDGVADGDGGGLKGGAIAGIVVGILVLVILVVLIVLLIRRQKISKNEIDFDNDGDSVLVL